MFEILKGETITKVEGFNKDSDFITFILKNGKEYKMFHKQSCCEDVRVEDICGDVDDILNSPILLAEEVSNSKGQPKGARHEYDRTSFTWTFYKLSTIKGSLTIRWYGTSNGYYSEKVSFEEIA